MTENLISNSRENLKQLIEALNEPEKLNKFLSELSDEQRDQMMTILKAWQEMRDKDIPNEEKTIDNPVSVTSNPQVEMKAADEVKQEIKRVIVLDEHLPKVIISPSIMVNEGVEELDAELEKFFGNDRNGVIKLLKESVMVQSHNAAVELSYAQESADYLSRIATSKPIMAARWVSDPLRHLSTVPAKKKKVNFDIKKWLKKPLDAILIQPVTGLGNLINRLVSKEYNSYENQRLMVKKNMDKISETLRKELEIQDLRWEALEQYVEEISRNAELFDRAVPNIESIDGFISECLNNAGSEHYQIVSQLVEKRKNQLMDEADGKLQEWFEYQISSVDEFRKDAMQKSRLFRLREALKRQTVSDLSKSFLVKLMGIFSLPVKPKLSLPEEVDATAEENPAEMKTQGRFRLSEMMKPKFSKFGLAGAAAIALTASAVKLSDLELRQNSRVASTNSADSSGTDQDKTATLDVQSSASTESKELTDIQQSQITDAATIAGPSSAQPDILDTNKDASLPNTKTTLKVDDTKKNSVSDSQAELPKPDKLSANEITIARNDAEKKSAALSTRIAALSTKVVWQKGITAPKLESPSKMDLAEVKGLLDQYNTQIKKAKTQEDLDIANALLAKTEQKIFNNEVKKAEYIFAGYWEADAKMIANLEKSVKHCRAVLGGNSGKFNIRYDFSHKNSDNTVNSFSVVNVNLDLYEKEYNIYLRDFNGAISSKKPLSEARLKAIDARLNWLSQQMNFVVYYLDTFGISDDIKFLK